MTFPVWIRVGPWQAHPHVVFEILAYGAAAFAYWRQRQQGRDHVSVADRWSLVTAAVVGAVLGSRLLFWFEDPGRTLGQLANPLYLLGGQTIVGGLLGGWLAVEWMKRRVGIREPTGDLFALPIAIGAGVGRLGCFLSGLPDGTYGLPTSLPWGVDMGDSLPRHPTALYESLFLLGLARWLSARPTARRGDRFLSLMTAYLVFRVAVEWLKPGVPLVAGLTAVQGAALGGLGACAYLWRTRGTVPSPVPFHTE